jgi:hypothetical protein
MVFGAWAGEKEHRREFELRRWKMYDDAGQADKYRPIYKDH